MGTDLFFVSSAEQKAAFQVVGNRWKTPPKKTKKKSYTAPRAAAPAQPGVIRICHCQEWATEIAGKLRCAALRRGTSNARFGARTAIDTNLSAVLSRG